MQMRQLHEGKERELARGDLTDAAPMGVTEQSLSREVSRGHGTEQDGAREGLKSTTEGVRRSRRLSGCWKSDEEPEA